MRFITGPCERQPCAARWRIGSSVEDKLQPLTSAPCPSPSCQTVSFKVKLVCNIQINWYGRLYLFFICYISLWPLILAFKWRIHAPWRERIWKSEEKLLSGGFQDGRREKTRQIPLEAETCPVDSKPLLKGEISRIVTLKLNTQLKLKHKYWHCFWLIPLCMRRATTSIMAQACTLRPAH